MADNKVSVYALWNHQDDVAFYVGSTIQPKIRFLYHCSGWSGKGMRRKIQELQDNGVVFSLRILEETDQTGRYDRENYWIEKMHHDGHPLVNVLWANPRQSIRKENQAT